MTAKVYTAQLVLVAVGLDGKGYIVDAEHPEVQELILESCSTQVSAHFDVSQLGEPGMYVWEGDIHVRMWKPDGQCMSESPFTLIWTGAVRRATLSDLAKCSRWRR